MKQKILNFLSRLHFVFIIELKSSPEPVAQLEQVTQLEQPKMGSIELVQALTVTRNKIVSDLEEARTMWQEEKHNNMRAMSEMRRAGD